MKYFILLSLIFAPQVFALNGSYKSYFSALDYPYSTAAEGSITNTLRTKFSWAPNETYSVQTAYALSANLQKKIDSTSQTKKDYRLHDLANVLYPSKLSNASNMTVTQNLDRLYVTYNASKLNIKIGRQPVAFGSAKMINPTDVLTPFSYQELDKEERTGVDAVRMNISLGELSLVDAGIVLGDKFKRSNSAAFLRLKVNFLDTDFSPILMDFKNNLLIGIDIARSVGQASTWLEAASFFPKKPEKSYLRATLGLDYKLTSSIYSYCEYHYNGAGASAPEHYNFLTNANAALKGIHYLVPGMSYELSPIWKFTGQFLLNANDSSSLSNLLIEQNIAQDIFVDVGTYLPLGLKSPTVQKSEFGIYPKIFYTSLRLYF